MTSVTEFIQHSPAFYRVDGHVFFTIPTARFCMPAVAFGEAVEAGAAAMGWQVLRPGDLTILDSAARQTALAAAMSALDDLIDGQVPGLSIQSERLAPLMKLVAAGAGALRTAPGPHRPGDTGCGCALAAND